MNAVLRIGKRLGIVGVLGLALLMISPIAFAQDAALEDHPEEVQQWLEMVRDEYGGTTIRASMGTHPSTEAFRAMEAEFEQLTDISVEWDIISEPNLRPKHFSLSTARSSEFDVWMVDGFYIEEYVEKETLFPIARFTADSELTPAWFDYEDILPAYRQAIAQVDGEPYAVPTAGESRFIAYRTDLFEEHGIAPPDTTDELLAAAQYFAEEVPGVFGMVSRAQQGIFYASGWLHVLYQFSDGWIDQETGEVTADSPGVVASLEYWNELLRTGPPDIAAYTHEEAASAFNTGDAALWFDATAIAGWLLDPERSDHTDSVGFLPPPEGPEGRYGGLAGWNLAVPQLTNNPDAAWAFIVWMTSRYNAKTYLDNGGVLVRQSLLDNPDVTSENPGMYEALQATFDAAANLTDQGMVWIPPTWLANPVLQVAGEWGNRALLGDVSAEEAASAIADEIRQMQEEWQ